MTGERKPLRRTAWTLVVGGFGALVGMIVVGVVLSSVTSAVRSPLIMAPVGAVFARILLFFPRFTLAWARLGRPSWRRR
ncbi:hypothetical protein BLA60_14405 [Actinophytocola xinjiangensis]|uniref:Uncharacterized protein n=1 Tax=Actinophytocola xinjiangensis TaxID=485602 RepID=A0A7Z0WNW2_9PSEU|nr:hypothetical protein BLA60_14405 [Actinophytocola xinjiangensis]